MAKSLLDKNQLQAVAKLFDLLAEPTRLDILQNLKKKPLSVGQIVDATNAKQSNISKQLGILHDSGLLKRERQGNLIFYSIADPMIFDLCALVCGKLRKDAESQLAVVKSIGH
ncbi:MAG: transcriptional regulator [Planctomycetes bacterium]|nr:transcriptional regulator [Planctomycetota bacterium]